MPEARWTLEEIKKGIERFTVEYGHLPTARDYDTVTYLPTARQVQRAYGGLGKLRESLGYTDINYTKGALRSKIATRSGIRGVEAEEALEIILITKFGEPFVHTQKRYIKFGKSRYDFFVYANDYSFGIDVFTTDRREYIDTNVRHKIAKYSSVPATVPVYFVLSGEGFEQNDILFAKNSLHQLINYPNIQLVLLTEFIGIIESIEPLIAPIGLKSIIEQI
jgi:hypothetical protein